MWLLSRRPHTPGLALVGLAGLALLQAAPLPGEALRVLSPATSTLWARLLPTSTERIRGDPNLPVPLPALTLSQDAEATTSAAMRLAAAWVLFQGVLGLSHGSGPMRRFGLALAVNATLTALFSLAQALSWNGKIYRSWSSPSDSAGPFVCHSHLAAYLNLGLGFALGLLLHGGRSEGPGRGRDTAFIFVLPTSILAVGALASLSRGGALSMLGALVMMLVVRRPRHLRIALGFLAVLGLIVALLLALGGEVAYSQRMSTLLDQRPYAQR